MSNNLNKIPKPKKGTNNLKKNIYSLLLSWVSSKRQASVRNIQCLLSWTLYRHTGRQRCSQRPPTEVSHSFFIENHGKPLKSMGNTWILDRISQGSGPQITPSHTPCLRTRLPQNQTHSNLIREQRVQNPWDALKNPATKPLLKTLQCKQCTSKKSSPWILTSQVFPTWCPRVLTTRYHCYWPKMVFLVLDHATEAHPPQKATRTITTLFWFHHLYSSERNVLSCISETLQDQISFEVPISSHIPPQPMFGIRGTSTRILRVSISRGITTPHWISLRKGQPSINPLSFPPISVKDSWQGLHLHFWKEAELLWEERILASFSARVLDIRLNARSCTKGDGTTAIPAPFKNDSSQDYTRRARLIKVTRASKLSLHRLLLDHHTLGAVTLKPEITLSLKTTTVNKTTYSRIQWDTYSTYLQASNARALAPSTTNGERGC